MRTVRLPVEFGVIPTSPFGDKDMNTILSKKPPMVVVILPGNEYQRYIGRTLTHHVKADRPLTAKEVEAFRVAPESIMEPEPA